VTLTLTALLLFVGWLLFMLPGKSPMMDGVARQEGKIINQENPIRIGYFLGGRVNIIYRTSIYDYFDNEGILVNLYTKFLNNDEIFLVPKSEEERRKFTDGRPHFGKMSGLEIVEGIEEGRFDGGTTGEASFIDAVTRGAPIVAVAQLGYDAVPGKLILMRSDIIINSPEDLKGKTFISRRAGPGDAIFFREFLKAEGISEEDVTVIDQVDEDDAITLLREKKIDGGLYHLARGKRIVEEGLGYVYRPMDWMNSQLSHSVLVFGKTYLETHREEVQRFVNAYVKRIAYEKSIPEEEKDETWNKGLMMAREFEEMNIPGYDLPPKVRVDFLEQIQDLLLEYGEIDKTVTISDFVDGNFVERAMEMMEK
jgi:ABC-type nitrate/sulfonate/bicarbonate transport system substrate-binding protein